MNLRLAAIFSLICFIGCANLGSKSAESNRQPSSDARNRGSVFTWSSDWATWIFSGIDRDGFIRSGQGKTLSLSCSDGSADEDSNRMEERIGKQNSRNQPYVAQYQFKESGDCLKLLQLLRKAESCQGSCGVIVSVYGGKIAIVDKSGF